MFSSQFLFFWRQNTSSGNPCLREPTRTPFSASSLRLPALSTQRPNVDGKMQKRGIQEVFKGDADSSVFFFEGARLFRLFSDLCR